MSSRFSSNIFRCSVFLFLIWAAALESTDAADKDRNFYSIPASDFRRSELVQQQIDFSDIDYELLSAAVFHETNFQREKHGIFSLTHLVPLDEAASMQAWSMMENDFLSHMNPSSPKQRTPLDRVLLTGVKATYVAENVALLIGIQYEPGKDLYITDNDDNLEFRTDPEGPPIPNHTYRTFARSLLEQWMNSPEHRLNILSEKAEFLGSACAKSRGGGIAEFYCVQVSAGGVVMPGHVLIRGNLTGAQFVQR